MNWRNEVTELLNLAYPIIQAPMLGVTTVEMVAAVSNLGGLGSLPVGGLSPEKTSELIRQTKQLTSKTFAVNLFANDIPEVNEEEISGMKGFLEHVCLKIILLLLFLHLIPFSFTLIRNRLKYY